MRKTLDRTSLQFVRTLAKYSLNHTSPHDKVPTNNNDIYNCTKKTLLPNLETANNLNIETKKRTLPFLDNPKLKVQAETKVKVKDKSQLTIKNIFANYE